MVVRVGSLMRVHLRGLRCGLKVDNIKPHEIVSLSLLVTMKSCTVFAQEDADSTADIR